MRWIILGGSCVAMLVGMKIGDVALAAAGLAVLLISLWLGPKKDPSE